MIKISEDIEIDDLLDNTEGFKEIENGYMLGTDEEYVKIFPEERLIIATESYDNLLREWESKRKIYFN